MEENRPSVRGLLARFEQKSNVQSDSGVFPVIPKNTNVDSAGITNDGACKDDEKIVDKSCELRTNPETSAFRPPNVTFNTEAKIMPKPEKVEKSPQHVREKSVLLPDESWVKRTGQFGSDDENLDVMRKRSGSQPPKRKLAGIVAQFDNMAKEKTENVPVIEIKRAPSTKILELTNELNVHEDISETETDFHDKQITKTIEAVAGALGLSSPGPKKMKRPKKHPPRAPMEKKEAPNPPPLPAPRKASRAQPMHRVPSIGIGALGNAAADIAKRSVSRILVEEKKGEKIAEEKKEEKVEISLIKVVKSKPKMSEEKARILLQSWWRGCQDRSRITKLKCTDSFKRAVHRAKVISEILSTEKSYFRSLFEISEFVIRPLRNEAKEESPILQEMDIDALFSSWDVLTTLHSELVSRLEEGYMYGSKGKNRTEKGDQVFSFPQIFLDITPYLAVYSDYVNHFNRASELASRLQTNERFRAFWETSEVNFTNQLNLPGYLIMPIQRIPRYELLLRDLLKHTEATHPEAEKLQKVLTSTRALAKVINEKSREYEQREEVANLVGKFDPRDHAILCDLLESSEKRYLVREGPMIMLSIDPKKKKIERYIFLLSDVIAIAEPAAKDKFYRFVLDKRFDLVDCTISVEKKEKKEKKKSKQCIILEAKDVKMVFVFSDMDLFTAWIRDLENTQDRELARRSETLSWYFGNEQGYIAQPRYACSMTAVNASEVYLFGGTDSDENVHDDLYCLNCSENEWTCPETTSCPAPRYFHTATLMELENRSIVVFGGTDGETRYNDVWIFDTVLLDWYELSNISGEAPAPRSGHSAAAVGSLLYVFGGRDSTGHFLSDLWVLDLTLKEWSCPAVGNQAHAPSARAWHSATAVGQNIYIFAGSSTAKAHFDLCTLDTQRLAWIANPDQRGMVPNTGRYGHSATRVRNRLIFTCGAHPAAGYYDDVLIYDTETHVWSVPILPHSSGALAFHAVATYPPGDTGQQIVLFGGKTDSGTMGRSEPLYVTVNSSLSEDEEAARRWLKDAKQAKRSIQQFEDTFVERRKKIMRQRSVFVPDDFIHPGRKRSSAILGPRPDRFLPPARSGSITSHDLSSALNEMKKREKKE